MTVNEQAVKSEPSPSFLRCTPKEKCIDDQNNYHSLGSFERKVTTESCHAQTWFNRGMIWLYSFNHDEAAKCFENAAAADSSCAMAYWGLAYSLGPNYNKPWELFDKEDLKATIARTYQAACTAKTLAPSATPVEQALIESVQHRYRSDYTPDMQCYAEQNRIYANKMETVYLEFADDLDVAALYADAMMNLTPWKLWDLKTGAPCDGARTLEVKRVLEKALDQKNSSDSNALEHPGLLHLYIHLVEMSPNPELGLDVADRLRDLVPDAGHMHHMPSHLDILVGDYRRAIISNHKATVADEKFVAKNGIFNFYSIYRFHNYHSLIYAAMLAGKKTAAFDAVSRMEATLPEILLRQESPPMADWVESFKAVRPHVMVRFGMWDEIIDFPLPEDQNLYSVTTATIHYAKGVAYAATGRVPEALQEQNLFRRCLRDLPSSRMDYPNKCVDTLAVGEAMLDGEIKYRQQHYGQAFVALSKAIDLENGLVYSEPWGWMQPVAHALAALLLEQGFVEQATDFYYADLGIGKNAKGRKHPNNVWALHGLHECLCRLGRSAEAEIIQPQLQIALSIADITIKSSCFCRRGSLEGEPKGCCTRT